VGVAEFDEKPLGLERDEFGHARLDRPDRYFVHPPGEPFSLVVKDSGVVSWEGWVRAEVRGLWPTTFTRIHPQGASAAHYPLSTAVARVSIASGFHGVRVTF